MPLLQHPHNNRSSVTVPHRLRSCRRRPGALPWTVGFPGTLRCVSIVKMGIPRRSTVRGRAIAAKRKVREYAMVVRAMADTSHPVLVQIIPTRFCNLSCAYCNEYDKVSEPVPLEEMFRRIDALGAAGNGDDRHLGWGAADASRTGRDYPADQADGRDCGDDHQRVPAESREDTAAERGGPGPHADLD